MKQVRFLKIVQQRTARLAATASATRGQGATGVVISAREFLADLRLGRFGTGDERVFLRQLNLATRGLQRRLPKRAASWGLARKLLNIFLRDSLYTSYLAKAHRLRAAERFLEIPLDSITAKHIRRQMPELPRWPGVKHLRADRSAAYQAAALTIGRRRGVARVHLDTYWWGARE